MRNETPGEAVHIAKWGAWFWVVTSGNRSLYFGPYKSKEEANKLGPKEAA